MRLLFYVLLVFSTLSFGSFKHTLLVEPLFGTSIYRNVDSQMTESLINPLDSKLERGFSRGLRLGYANQYFQMGAEFITQDKFRTDSQFSYTVNDLGGFFNYKLTPKLRLMLSGYFLSSINIKHPDFSAFFFKGGVGFGVGGSYNVMKYMAVNLAFKTMNYSTLENFSGGTMDPNNSLTSLVASISFPFEFDFSFWYIN